MHPISIGSHRSIEPIHWVSPYPLRSWQFDWFHSVDDAANVPTPILYVISGFFYTLFHSTNCCVSWYYLPIDPPLVAIEPDGIIPVNETSSMQLWCTYDANPTNLTEIVWYKNRVPINFDQWSPDKLWTSKDERGTPILTVNDIDRNDSAEYSCRLRNTFGVSDSITSAKLEVACMCSGSLFYLFYFIF